MKSPRLVMNQQTRTRRPQINANRCTNAEYTYQAPPVHYKRTRSPCFVTFLLPRIIAPLSSCLLLLYLLAPLIPYFLAFWYLPHHHTTYYSNKGSLDHTIKQSVRELGNDSQLIHKSVEEQINRSINELRNR